MLQHFLINENESPAHSVAPYVFAAYILRMVEDWRPIETAPKDDHVEILLTVGGRTRVGYWLGGADPADLSPNEEPWTPNELAAGWYVLEPDVEDTPAEPTHWMPMPDPALEK